MAEYFTWTKLFEAGGVTLITLIVCSIVSFIVIIERAIYFHSKRFDQQALLERLQQAVNSGGAAGVVGALADAKNPADYVLRECAQVAEKVGAADDLYEEAKSRAISEKLPEMERYLSIEATLGSVAPFIGLLGTVIGIIRSFQSLGGNKGQAGLAGLNAGIAEALIATAAGLFVAIPAVIAYNYFRGKVSSQVLGIEVMVSRLKQMLLGA